MPDIIQPEPGVNALQRSHGAAVKEIMAVPVIRKENLSPQPSPKEQRVKAAIVNRIFENAAGRRPTPGQCNEIVTVLNAPWRDDLLHGMWELRRAIRVILDDVPKVLDRVSSPDLKYRLTALLSGATAMQGSDISIPATGERPPWKVKQPQERRERDMLFPIVLDTLGGSRSRARAARITSELLKEIDVNVDAQTILKDLQRRIKDNKRSGCPTQKGDRAP